MGFKKALKIIEERMNWLLSVTSGRLTTNLWRKQHSRSRQAFEMCRVGNWNLSHASLTSPEALAGLRDLRKTNPTLHASLSQTTKTDPTSGAPDNGDGEIRTWMGMSHFASGGSGIAANLSVDANGGITRSGDAEA
ncbi:hypothetical protein B0H19DRAFT_1085423 [Mycena capillaripes]|nr:hypothetical protein B0H19DRAFT_1085423 [Mycena capillaripes]